MNSIAIETLGVKREVPLPANICLTRSQAEQIRDAMNEFIGGGGAYGWITIHCDKPLSAGANTKPFTWLENVPRT